MVVFTELKGLILTLILTFSFCAAQILRWYQELGETGGRLPCLRPSLVEITDGI